MYVVMLVSQWAFRMLREEPDNASSLGRRRWSYAGQHFSLCHTFGGAWPELSFSKFRMSRWRPVKTPPSFMTCEQMKRAIKAARKEESAIIKTYIDGGQGGVGKVGNRVI